MIKDIIILAAAIITGVAVPIGIGWLIEEMNDLF